MKKLFSFLLCLQLVMAPVVFAGTEKDRPAAGDQFRSNPEAKNGGMGFYMSQILALSTAGIGSTILLNCKLGAMMPSMKIFMAGSLVYIGSEIMGGKAQNQAHMKKMEDMKMVEEKMQQGGDLQKSTLETALKEEKDTLEFIQKRKKWMMAITAIYTAATAAAVLELMKSIKATALKAKGIALQSNPFTLGAGVSMEAAAMAMVQNNFPQAAQCAGGYGTSLWVKAALVGAYSFAVGNAGGTNLSKYGAMGVGLGVTMTALSVKAKMMYELPKGRIISFGASAALAGLVMKGLMDKEKVAKANVKMLEKHLAGFNEDASSEGSIAVGASLAQSSSANFQNAGQNNPHNSAVKYDVKALPVGQVAKQCWTQTAAGPQYTENCSQPIKLSRPNFDANLNVPTVSTVSNMGTDMGNSVANGDMAAADVSASGLANMAGRMGEVKDNLVGQLNEALKASGDRLDLDAEVKKQVAEMTNDLNKGMAGSGSSLAALDSDSGSSTFAVDDSKEDESNKDLLAAASRGEISSASMKISEGVPSESDSGSGMVINENARPESIDNFVINEADISKKSETSIFDQLSNRYIMNYSRIFERKAAVSQETQPKQ